MNNLTEVIVGGGLILLVIAAAYLITVFASYWNTKKESILEDIYTNETFGKMQWMQYLLKKVINVVDNVVAALNDTYKKQLLDSVSDGKLGDDEKRALRDKALELITVELPDSIWEELSDIVGDVEETIKTFIENSVSAQKKGSTALKEYEKQQADENK